MANSVIPGLEQHQEVTLLDILDGVLEKGVVIVGDLTISVANIDLIYLDLRILVTAVETVLQDQVRSRGVEGGNESHATRKG